MARFPDYEKGSKLKWNERDLFKGREVIIQRGSGNYFLGEVVEFGYMRNGKGVLEFNLVKLKVFAYYYREESRPLRTPIEIFGTSTMTFAYAWRRSMGPSAPSPSSDPEIEEQERRRASRRAYVAQAGLLKRVRSELKDQLTFLGLTPECSMDELRKLRRKLMVEWHPDRKEVFLAGGKGSEEEFDRQSEQVTSALAYVESYIVRRDSSRSVV